MTGIGGMNAYQQTNQVWNQRTEKSEVDTKSAKSVDSEKAKADSSVKTSIWKPVRTDGPLVPTDRDGIGMSIGEVQLSDKAKEYYSQLKKKFGNMEFIAVSSDKIEQVKANAAAYGNSNKMVVLIDEAKLEKMATDESFRKKYEGIIAMSQNKLAGFKNSLASSGASVKNFGMSINADGSTSFFATLEKSSKEQTKRIEKKQAEKKAQKAKEKKLADKKAQEKRLEKSKEDKNIDSSEEEKQATVDHKEYVKIEASSMEDLLSMVSKYAYGSTEQSVMTDSEKSVGQHFDFKG